MCHGSLVAIKDNSQKAASATRRTRTMIALNLNRLRTSHDIIKGFNFVVDGQIGRQVGGFRLFEWVSETLNRFQVRFKLKSREGIFGTDPSQFDDCFLGTVVNGVDKEVKDGGFD